MPSFLLRYISSYEFDDARFVLVGALRKKTLGEEFGSRSQSLNDQTAHQNRGDGFAGDAEGQHRDQGAAGVAALLPQAHSANTMHRARISARYFFILFSSF